MDILKMTRDDLSALKEEEVDHLLTPDEWQHMARTLDSYWEYDYNAAQAGKVGLHALLKSEKHSDGFFVSRVMLAHENILRIIAGQMVRKIREQNLPKPDYVVGVPDGATKLGEVIAEMLGTKVAEMKKVDGRIVLITVISPHETILLIEDVCTRGTGFTEAATCVMTSQPEALILPLDPVIINRGGLEFIEIPGLGRFRVVPVVNKRISDWEAADCPLCRMGSKPIKPKATDENWLAITTSQQ